jgi:tRNA(Ile)-lysidine synthase
MDFLHSHASVICFGHNRDDVAETMLLRIGRGSGLDGLSGPRPVQRFRERPGLLHLRPLLDLSSGEIRAALRRCGIPWREDSTNAGLAYARNRLRHQVIPMLDAALGRDWAAGAARSRERVAEADELLDEMASRMLEGAGEGLSLAGLRAAPPAIARRTLELWLCAQGLRESVGAKGIGRILDCGCKTPELGSIGLHLRDGLLLPVQPQGIIPRWGPLAVVAGSEVFFPDGSSLKIEALRFGPGEANACIEALRWAKSLTRVVLAMPVTGKISIRRRLPGDRYRPLGSTGFSKVQDAFVNRKIPLAERDLLPIVLMEGSMAWCPNLPPSEDFKLTGQTKEAVRLTYSGQRFQTS